MNRKFTYYIYKPMARLTACASINPLLALKNDQDLLKTCNEKMGLWDCGAVQLINLVYNVVCH